MLLKQMVKNIIALKYVCITMDILSKTTTAINIAILLLVVVVELVLLLLFSETKMLIDCFCPKFLELLVGKTLLRH